MQLSYNKKKIELVNCRSFYSRLKGFMFDKDINKALLFDKCNSIHTFFMFCNIDVIMCNKENTIIKYYNNLAKNKVILPKKAVTKVYEMPVNYFNNVKIGDKMEVIE